jgi:hypothetical protein
MRGSFIGGPAPQSVSPQFPSSHQKYFGTIGFDEGFGVSIFYSLDIRGEAEERDILRFNNRVLYPSIAISAVVHPEAERARNPCAPSELSSHAIVFGAPSEDLLWIDRVWMPSPGSKVGGRPVVDNTALVESAFAQVEKGGYHQLFQFDTPNPTACPYVRGFPWDPGWLHVFVRGRSPEDLEFAFVIQQ